MSTENKSGLFDKVGELCRDFGKFVIIWFILRAIFPVLDAFPAIKDWLEPLRPALNIPPVAWLVQFLLVVKYTAPIDILINIAFFFGLFYLTLHLLTDAVFPLKSWREAWQARGYMIGVTHLELPHPVIRASNGTYKVYGTKPERALGPGIVVCDGVTALALEKQNAYARVVGPGFEFLRLEERVQAAVDLRPQNLRRTVTAATREGIEVEIDLSVNTEIEHGIDWKDEQVTSSMDNPVARAIYAERAQVSETTAIPPAPRSAADWCATIATICEDTLRQIVAGYMLDQLLAADNPERNPRQEIGRQLLDAAREQVGRYGGALRSVSLSHIRPPRAVLEQRIQNWLADWQRRERTLKALGEARRIQLEESARALAQTEILQSLADTLTLQSESHSIELLSLRLVEALEQMAHEPATGMQLETSEIEFIHKLAELLNPKPTEGKS
ncbi:MAG: hypothetical protein HY868_22325 [Chloroflexi bacterium]|nr:hypothetical protein [Chloroflexota bacterium]